jgi:hypothetical protein
MIRNEYGVEGPLGFPLPDRQARQLDTLLKALPRTREYDYRHTIVTKAPTELNPGERSDVSWISTENVDREGEVVLSRGMNNSQFIQNPVVTLQHAYHLPPVGRSLWQKRVKDGSLVGVKAKTKYPEKPADWSDPWPPDKVFSLVQAGLLQGKSIGFLPTRVHFADPKEAKQSGWPEGTLVIDEWLLLEYACVFLPANQNALVEAVSKGSIDLPEEIARALGFSLPAHKEENPAPPNPDSAPPARVVSFTPLAEVERAVTLALAGFDPLATAERLTREAIERRQGRV